MADPLVNALLSARRGRGRRSAASLPTANCTITERAYRPRPRANLSSLSNPFSMFAMLVA